MIKRVQTSLRVSADHKALLLRPRGRGGAAEAAVSHV